MITELGYIGLSVSSLAAWRDFAGGVLGLEVVPLDAKSFHLRMDYWHHRIHVQEDGGDDIAAIGWRVASPADLDEVKHRLTKNDIAFREASASEASERHRLGFIECVEPGGIKTEIFYGPRIETALPFYPGRRMHGPFITGKGGFGHAVIDQPDTKKAEQFYNMLGLRGSVEFDRNTPGGRLEVIFMSCNPRQHSLAFANFKRNKRLNHLMTECARLEDVGLTRDLAKAHKTPFMMEIGQHQNDGAVSFYITTPSGWAWEVGWGVKEPSGQAEYAQSDIWGHEFMAPPGR